MAGRPHELEGTSLELDHLHTHSDTAASPRRVHALHRSRATRRTALSTVGLIGAALGVLFAGGAMVSAANGAPVPAYDPAANAVRAVGGAPALGPATGMRLNESLVDIAATPSGRGYWTTASDGGVFSFGDAPFLGSVASFPLVEPVVGIAGTPSGNGYWLVAADGGVFAFGDAAFHGSIAGADTAGPAGSAGIVGIASTPSGNGYWLVGADGGVFAFGDAAFQGAATTFRAGAPIVDMAPTPSGYGYFLLGADGGVFAFGDARFAGSAVDGRHLASAIAIPSSGNGYFIARTDGSVVGRGGAASVEAPVDFLVGQHPVVALAARPRGGAWLITSFSPPAPAQSSLADDPFLKCTRAHESDSAGGYRAVSPGGVYRGAYQFLRSTWNNTARAAGRADLVGVDPAAASPADQDAMAMFLYRQAGPGPWGGRCRGLS